MNVFMGLDGRGSLRVSSYFRCSSCLHLRSTPSLMNEFPPFLRELEVLERVENDFITQVEVLERAGSNF